ncbi:MAG TPA: histidine kinase N-terminal 7TM domain-containing protein [Anaerolineae bacterium]|nr:histidine kinase N-terminal 7TM domain-containing protein [Anaerolineae bacterium]
MQGITYALPLFAAAGALALLAHYGWRHRRAHPAAPAFVWLILPVAVWLVAYGFEIMGSDVAAKEAWETVIIVSLAWLPFFWLLFAVQYSGQEAWLTRRNLALLILPSIATTLLTVSNPLHGLVWTDILLDDSGPFLATVPVRGPWFWLHTLFSYSYILAGNGLFVVFISRSAGIFRGQALAVVLSSMIPLLGNALHLTGMIPVPGLDPGAFAFALSAAFTALALFRYHLLVVVPVAQRVVLDHLLEGVIVLDPHDRILDINPAARRMLHLGPGEMVGQPATAVLQPPEILTHCAVPGQEPERILVTRGDVQRWYEVLALPMTAPRGRFAGRILVVRDVTEARAVELLRQDLARITVHDLRNPLNVVSAGLDVLADAAPGAIDPGLGHFVQLARSSCGRALDLVNSILQMSQLESGQMPLNRRPIQAARLITDVAQGLGLLAREGGLALHVEAPGNLPLVWADETLLRRVLENLAGNALKFTPPGGRVSIAAQPRDDTLLLQVSDTGPGIPRELEGRLFEKFSSGPGPQQGTGLGLAFCRLAVEAHGGRIWVEDSSPQGTSVHCTFPLWHKQGRK